MPDKIQAVGSRAQVWHETARATSGGLKKKDLFMKKGRIVSRRASAAGKKALKFLTRQGYIAKKGTFKLMSKSMARSPKKSHGKKSRGKRHGKSRATRKRGGFWFEEAKPAAAPAASTVADLMKGAMGSVKMDSAAKPYGSKQ